MTTALTTRPVQPAAACSFRAVDPLPSDASLVADVTSLADPVRESIAGTDTDHAIAALAGLYAGKRWHAAPTDGPFWFRYAALGDTELSLRRSQMHGALRGDVATGDDFVVEWIDRGAARIDVGRDEVVQRPHQPALFPPGRPFDFVSEDWDQRLVHVHRDLVLDVASERYDLESIGGGGDALLFDHTAEPTPAATERWFTAVRAASAALRTGGAGSLRWHEASRGVAAALLELYPPRLDAFHDALSQPDRANLRRAVDFIHAHARDPLTVGAIACAANTSIRSLQENFRNVLGTTPMLYLREVRLDGVRADLLAADPHLSSVGTIAGRWGFSHLGRFAGEYAQRFGERPSHTLRRTR
ncbi:AraC family transcriptional regulator [Curtobacterium sp. ISL-83]|uniref:AraC family transcriptional regulator n=1 Tax=Curtobacterium sp. ISL-83 TaxID=2819145 RepID=UPI001BE7703E|nr:AraC family transcriptional regulator [Curtobacterium sp. ISL-83]MBT2504017.1 helix-turn-helix transcriptional regulator [Curtobacterium sp. ISL-83]